VNVVIVLWFLLLWLPELPGFLHRRNVREIALFSVLWAAGLGLWLAVNSGVPTDQVTKALRAIFEPIGMTLIKPPPPA